MSILELLSTVDDSIKISPNGWCTIPKARTMAMLIVATKPVVSVEIGVYTGKSAIAMALAHKFLGKGQVLCIDPWKAEASAEWQEDVHKEWWSKIDHEAIYREFINHIIKFGVTAQVDIKREKSDHVEPPRVIDFLHIDGNHSQQAIRDVSRFASRVPTGGIVVMDDIEWPGGQVKVATQNLLNLGFIELFKLGTGAVYQKQ